MSQADLAENVGISKRMIAYYELETTNPPLDKIEKIADALSVNIHDLIKKPKHDETQGIFSYLDARTVKRVNKLLSLNKHDRSKIYQMVDLLLQKPEYKDATK